jgi:hypothetical protein
LIEGIDFAAAKIRVAKILDRPDLIHHKNPGCTLPAYAALKELPIGFLAELGVREVIGEYGKPELEIPYRGEDGKVVTIRRRIALTGKKHTLSAKGSTASLYGLDRLAAAKAAGFAFLVEGESDSQTLWFNDYPAFGLSGAGTYSDRLAAATLAQLPEIYATIEPDQAGEGLAHKLAGSAIADHVRLVRFANGIKDASAL